MDTTSNLVDKLFDAAFDTARDPRSDEYKAGVRAALEYRVNGAGVRCRHRMPSARADAFFAGVAEGHAIWRRHAEAEGHADKASGGSTTGA